MVVACKFMETILVDAVMRNAVTHELISPAQFGYRRGNSTVLQLLETYNEIAISVNKGSCVEVVMLDSNAFKTSSHQKLIDSLPSFGIGPTIQMDQDQRLPFWQNFPS